METIRLRIEKKGRRGKTVTLLDGFTRDAGFLEDYSKKIKQACGTGGTLRGRTIEIQGDFRQRVRVILAGDGFNVKA